MNIYIIKDDDREITINVDYITHMEFSAGETEADDQLKVFIMGGADFIFKGDAARAIQFDIDTMLYELSTKTAVVEINKKRGLVDIFSTEKANAEHYERTNIVTGEKANEKDGVL